MAKLVLAAVVAASLALSGCATVITGTTQTMNVQVINAKTNQLLPDASCMITDAKGNHYAVRSNPGNVTISKGDGALQVLCQSKGYKQTALGVGQSFNAWTIVNVLFWPGFIVDAVTGSIQHYPSHVTVLMVKSGEKVHILPHGKK